MLPVLLLARHGAVGCLAAGPALLQLHTVVSLGLAAVCTPWLIAVRWRPFVR